MNPCNEHCRLHRIGAVDIFINPAGGARIPTLDSLIADTAIDKVIPGHGQPSNRKALAAQHDYFTSITGAVGDTGKLDEQ